MGTNQDRMDGYSLSKNTKRMINKKHWKQEECSKHDVVNEQIPHYEDDCCSKDQDDSFPFIPKGYKPFVAPRFGSSGKASKSELPFPLDIED